ncbi:BFD/(2Fe-2S)-binding domain-containing protein [Caballeronia udeis]|uniref:BFD/(2Fe-2S)-binding domain-containing protein n=1 Tax=Caballeronia udeis TaxID=1232866 RepID=A0A158I7V1_9BURK|nr:FAD-dependent oxidoreductase [Caballeronia udeis]SAL52645.1 BFD/(2Fe-2S)-binding domain-containing protein [Caballeronia udeis]
MTQTIPIQFDGETLHARAGETLAAALIAHGVQQFRTTVSGQPRGVFCGMGVCQDCLVEIDGVANRRACMTKIEKPVTVRRGVHARPLPPVTASASGSYAGSPEPEIREPALLVIGAGPGGLSAALFAQRAGVQVTVLDERSQAGGQYYKQLGVSASASASEPGIAPPDAQHRRGAALIESARKAGVEIIHDALVWGAFEPKEFIATVRGRSIRFRPAACIVATGAYERGWQVPGWTLPGVMTTGAAQTLWRTSRRLPGKRVLIAGNGPLNLQLAAELLSGGASVAAVVEAAPRPGLATLGPLVTMALAAPGLVAEGVGYSRMVKRNGVHIINDTVIEAIEKTGSGLSVTLARVSGETLAPRIDVDIVCLGYGFEPANELLRALGCTHDFDTDRRQLATRRDDTGLTSVAGVYALGDCTGLGGAKAALAEGSVVGAAVAVSLGHALAGPLAGERDRAVADLARQRRFQQALWTVYASPLNAPKERCGDTVICRCEEVTFGELDAALDEGLSTVGAIKRRTRIGMGRCQGRYCAPVLDEIVCERFGRSRDEMSGFAPRVPVKPVSIAELAGHGDDS